MGADSVSLLPQEEQKQSRKQAKTTAVSDNLKFGRGKKSVAAHFAKE
jgi:hypothetical protein